MQNSDIQDVLDQIARSIHCHVVESKGATNSIPHIQQRLTELKAVYPDMKVNRFLALCFFGGEEPQIHRYYKLREAIANVNTNFTT